VRNTIKGFAMTAGLTMLLVLSYVLIELARGNVPFAMLQWNVGGKFVTITFTAILALGTALGYASDQLQKRKEH
jgi:hypothetical protein